MTLWATGFLLYSALSNFLSSYHGKVEAFSTHRTQRTVHKRHGLLTSVERKSGIWGESATTIRTMPISGKRSGLGMTTTSNNNVNFESLFKGFTNLIGDGNKEKKTGSSVVETIKAFIEAQNDGNVKAMLNLISSEIELIDTSLYSSIIGKDAIQRHFYLLQNAKSITKIKTMVVDETVEEGNSVFVMYHYEETCLESGKTEILPDTTGMTFYTLNQVENDLLIESIFDVVEPPSPKPGNAGLNLLDAANTVIETGRTLLNKREEINLDETDSKSEAQENESKTVVESYFLLFNKRDMESAIELFDVDCDYNDMQYPEAFRGKDAMKVHLEKVASCLPKSFSFKIDKIVTEIDPSRNIKYGVQWHVENDGEILPFTRGCSFYEASNNRKSSLIQRGIDIPEPAVLKLGSLNKVWLPSISKYFSLEPIRILPFASWVAYMYIVFFSTGILPGANALALEQRTWEEVRDLSLNFMFVSPSLHLPIAADVHPMLEGIFNLLLAWAALFAGFLSDDREEKPNLLPMDIIVIGMQFLTSAFLLPYLALRSPEPSVNEDAIVYKEDIRGEVQSLISEWKWLGVFGGTWGLSAILWAFWARYDEYGAFQERYSSLIDLLSIDRVGSSFVVDLIIFGLFQCWFIDDDMKRRQMSMESDTRVLRWVGKYIPFFGLAAYYTFRAPLPSKVVMDNES